MAKLIAIYFGGTLAGIFLPDIVQYLPFQLADTAMGAQGGFGGGGPAEEAGLSADLALLLLGGRRPVHRTRGDHGLSSV